MKDIKWEKDSEGDWLLRYKGDYFGMVCRGFPRCEGSFFLSPTAAWGMEEHAYTDTVKEAKQLLEGVARGEMELKVVKKA